MHNTGVMFNIADVALKNSGLKSIFSYLIPTHMSSSLMVGQLVEVKIRNQTKLGIVYKIYQSESALKLKPIINIIHPDLCLDQKQIAIAEKISHNTCSSLGSALFSFMPIIQGPPQTVSTQLPKTHVQPIVKLNAEQHAALKIIYESKIPVLLYGITGSGKTEVYLHSAIKTLDLGGSVLILVPEISLTPQTVARFKKQFGDIVETWHSKLTTKQRREIWWGVKSETIKVIIGSRSALFLPFAKLGLIVIDEEHDNSYYQESAPRYNALDVANYYHQEFGTNLILGSATPSAESVWKASTNIYKIAKIEARFNKTDLPITIIVDLSQEKLAKGSILSYPLIQAINEVLKNKQQAVLLLNRRGFAPATICTECGYISKCPNCNISLTAHRRLKRDSFDLVCHHCDFTEPQPSICPKCNQPSIFSKGFGTESVFEDLQAIYPHNRILRADKDTTSGRESINKIYQSFSSGEYDILIGTQMIAKGWDIPNVALVGILLAESGLMIPDFRSSSNTFNLLVQASGRSGRGNLVGKTIIQTFQPDNPLIHHIAMHDFGSYIKEELNNRKIHRYPPFTNIIRFVIQHSNRDICQQESDKFAKKILQQNYQAEILGPSPCFFERVRDKYRYHIIIKTNNKSTLEELKNLYGKCASPWSVEINPGDLL